MKKTTVAIALIAGLLVPAGATGKSNDADRRAAKAECKTERGKSSATREAFKARYGSMSRCVSRTTAEEESERKTARANAAHECKAERATLGREEFAKKYGTNGNKSNAHGKCVSTKAKAKKAELDAEDAEEAAERKRAARQCAAERDEMGREEFAAKYVTNASENAFGKCVSKTAREA
jgi:hypothetical protein